MGQGYFFARPVAPEEIESFFTGQQPDLRAGQCESHRQALSDAAPGAGDQHAFSLN